MKITDGISKILGIQKTNSEKIKVDKVAQVRRSADNLSISNEGKDYQVARKALKNIPDIREEKVKEFQERMQSGTYNVSAEELADKIINIFDKKI